MNIIDLGITDELIEQSLQREWITERDATFLFGLIDYPVFTSKQETWATLCMMKIERGLKREDKARAIRASQDGDFKQTMEEYQAIKKPTCPHCGHKMTEDIKK